MCIIHDQKMACGCWRKLNPEVTVCIVARSNASPLTGAPVRCPLERCEAAIHPSIWYCINHAPCKEFTGNHKALFANLNKGAVAHILRTDRYDFELRPPREEVFEQEQITDPAPAYRASVHSVATTKTDDSNSTASTKQSMDGLEIDSRTKPTAEHGGRAPASTPTSPREYRSSYLPGGYIAYKPARTSTC